VRGEVTLPGSKSLTNRALLLAALCDRPVMLTGALFSEDTHLMAEALRKLGFTVEADEAVHTLRVSGQDKGFTVGEADLFVGLAGTAARFLTALCAAAPRGIYRIDGIPQMRKRPMKPLIDALRTLGADVRCTGVEGFFPLEIHARGLRGGPVSIDASESSQLLSALLMVAPRASHPIEVTLIGGIRWPFVAMTINQMAQFGFAQKLERKGDTIAVPIGRYASPASYPIESDATASSYFTALPLAGTGAIHIFNLLPPAQGLQGDSQFLSVLERVGASVTAQNGDVDVTIPPGKKLRGVTQNFSEFSDTFLTLAALAPLLESPTRITGIAHSRKQETDRVAGMVAELRKLGQDVDEHLDGDGLTITPRPLKSGVEIETYGDHRFAMSFGILGCHNLHGDGRPWLSIKTPGCCAKTFPHFFELLESLRQKSLAHP
jgi:3-phosphoshikimate 1-carboxyvinyltransferase